MSGDSRDGESLELESFRAYLRVLAAARLDPRLQARLDPSDLVQQTLLEAHQGRSAFRGTTRREMAGWLRRILARNLANAVRDLRRQCRDVQREQSLDALLRDSSVRLEAWLADEESPPDVHAEQREELDRLARAIAELPDGQREAVLLRYFRGLSLADVARHLGRSAPAVAGLLQRGLIELRRRLHPTEEIP
jgi:RNA polymerase sigma-70 factor (ECF subfamily)